MKEAYNCALRLLSRREHGEQELVNKLVQKGFSELEAFEAIEQCQHLGYQSDIRYAQSLYRTRANQGYGPVRIEQQLKQVGICAEIIEEAYDATEADWVALAKAVKEKKFRADVEPSFEHLQKQKQFLRYRGFPTSVINHLFESLDI